MHHLMKLNDMYFDAVRRGIKTFEIRRDDRGFEVGDYLRLYRVDYHGNSMPYGKPYDYVDVKVVYILRHNDFPDGIPDNYCVMGIEVIG